MKSGLLGGRKREREKKENLKKTKDGKKKIKVLLAKDTSTDW